MEMIKTSKPQYLTSVDPLDFMTLEELEELQDRIRKVMLSKAIKEIIERKKKEPITAEV